MPESNRRRTPPWLRAARYAVLAIVVILFVFGFQLAKLYTDSQWFAELGQSGVFSTTIGAKLQLFFGFGLLFFLVIWFNLWLARRMNAGVPRSRPLRSSAGDIEREKVAEMLRHGADRSAVWIAVVVSVLVAVNAAGQWSDYLMFTHAGHFGTADPVFGYDIGFYVFRVPFFSFLQGWLLFTILAALVFSAVYHMSQGAVDINGQSAHVEPAATRHIFGLVGLAAIAYAWGILLDRFGLLTRENGPFFGAGYTDLHARLPALNMQAFGMALTGILCLAAMRSRRPFRLPLIGVAVWAIGLLVVGGIYPAILQNYSVTPNQQSKERPYIAHDIEFTQRAYGLDNVQIQDFPATESLSTTQLATNRATIDNIRLWDWPQLGAVYTVRQALRSFYRFSLPEEEQTAGEYNIDVDRYHLGGEYKQVMLGARELNVDALPSGAKTWQNQRLQYTHGYGAVMSPVHRVDTDGLPEYLMSGMPVQTARPELKLTRPQIYFGELTTNYAFVDSKEKEFDYPLESAGAGAAAGGQAAGTSYSGKGGVPLGGEMSRIAWSMRLGDTNMLLSSDLSDQSRILFRRNIRERVEELAPYLHWDRDPYLVVDGGRLVWMMDGYTVSDRYPYAKPYRSGSGAYDMDEEFNYIRNSVKAVVDSYDGSVNLYVSDAKDPIIATWSRVFPGLYKPLAQMPASLQAHLRYPEDLFRIQRDIYTIYHISNPDSYYLKDDAWDVPIDPTTGTDANGQPAQAGRMAPYYVIMKLPGSQEEEFLLMTPFTPLSQGNSAQNLAAWMSARCDPKDYGKLLVYRFPKGTNINGPQQTLALIRKQRDVSEFETLLGQRGSKVIYGNLLIIPIESSLLYCVPVYVQASGSGSVPGLQQVIVVSGKQIVMRPTLDQAIAALGSTGGPQVAATEETPESTTPTRPSATAATPGTVPDLLRRASTAYQRSRQKLREYNTSLDEMGRALDDLQRSLGGRR
jgi:uncharacterized membrane protein (UPF0182 family)